MDVEDLALPRLRAVDAGAALLITVLVVFAFWEVVAGGRTLTSSVGVAGVNGVDPPPGYGPVDVSDPVRIDRGASAWQFEPWAEVVHEQMAKGEIPLWNPYQGSGTPLAANMQSAVFDPLLLPLRVHPSPRVWDLTFLALFVMGGVATYVFGRVLGLGTAASFTGAAGFMLSGFFIVYSNNQFFRVYFYLPVLLLLVEVLVRSNRLLPVVGLGLAIALTVLAGMPEPSFFVLAAAAAYGGHRILWGPRAASRMLSTVNLGAAAVLGLGLAAPLILSFLEYLPLSFNLHSGTTGLQADLPGSVIHWIVPRLPAVPRPGHPEQAREWIGLAVPMLGLIALSAPSVMRRHRGWFFAGCTALLLLKQYGVGAVQWMADLPMLDRVLFPYFAAPVTAFCLAMLAAAGVQAIAQRSVGRVRLAAAVALMGLLLFAAIRLDIGPIRTLAARELVEQFGIAAMGGVIVVVAAARLPRVVAVGVAIAVLAGARLILPPAQEAAAAPYQVLVLAAGVAAGVVLLVRRRPPRPDVVIATIAVVAELLLLVPRGLYARLWDPYIRPPWLQFVAAEGSGSAGGHDRVFGLNGKLYPNTAGVFGIQDIRTLDALYIDRYVSYIRTFVEPEFDDRFTGHLDESTRPNMDANPMWDLLGVRYLLTVDGEGMAPFLNRIFAATRQSDAVTPASVDASGDRRTALVARGTQTVVYPLYGDAVRGLSFSYAVLGDTAAAGAKLAVNAVSPAGRTPVWRADLPAGSPETWRNGSADLSHVAGPVRALELVSSGPVAPGGVAWAGLEVHHQDGSIPPNRLRPVGSAAGVAAFEDAGRMPRAFVAGRAHRVAGEAEAIRYLSRAGTRFADGAVRVEGFDPASEVVVEGGPGDVAGVAPMTGGGDRESARGARITSYRAGRVEVSATADRPGVLVLTDVFFPGWKATVNGRPAKILPANVAFRGVRVGAGTSTIVFEYEPTTFRAGVGIAGLGAGALAAATVWTIVRRRRRESPRES